MEDLNVKKAPSSTIVKTKPTDNANCCFIQIVYISIYVLSGRFCCPATLL